MKDTTMNKRTSKGFGSVLMMLMIFATSGLLYLIFGSIDESRAKSKNIASHAEAQHAVSNKSPDQPPKKD